jgi:dienelactone hydrolase
MRYQKNIRIAFFGILGMVIGLLLIGSSCKDSGFESDEDALATVDTQESLRKELGKLMKIHGRQDDSLRLEFEAPKDHDMYTEHRLRFDSNGDTVPGHLLIPKNGEKPYPVMICLQGHAPGMFISLGEYRNEKEKKLVAGGRDLAVQAVDNGWAALVIEQKGFGERQKDSMTCNHQSLQELMHGRTMIGERVDDIRRTVDVIYSLDSLANDKIGIIGNSSGGTTGYYASAMDPRIDLAVVSCSFSTLETSWLKYPHCACGYIPGLLETADMPELAELISPRDLIIVAGDEDYLADIDGVREGITIAREYYKEDGAENKLKLIVGQGGHQFYPEKTWPVITEILRGWDE